MKKSQDHLNEEKTAAASYVLSFYDNIMLLNQWDAAYNNLILYYDNTFPKDQKELIKLDETNKQQLLHTLENVRSICRQIIIQYKTLMKSLQKPNEQKIITTWDNINQTFIIKRTDLMQFTEELNYSLVENIMQKLLQNSNDMIDKMYNNEKTNKPTE